MGSTRVVKYVSLKGQWWSFTVPPPSLSAHPKAALKLSLRLSKGPKKFLRFWAGPTRAVRHTFRNPISWRRDIGALISSAPTHGMVYLGWVRRGPTQRGFGAITGAPRVATTKRF